MVCALAALWAAYASSAETQTTPPAVVSIQVEPERITLHAASRQQQLLISAVDERGRAWDVTSVASISVVDDRIAIVAPPRAGESDGTGAIRGISDGQTEVVAGFAGHEVRVPLAVTGIDHYPPVHFGNDVVPILTKLGCNSGGCHGRAAGQNGFKLSVFGYDPNADYEAIVQQGRGRRVFPASPAASLILAKPAGGVPHGGGLRLKVDSLDYELVRQWITQGMPEGSTDAPTLVGLDVVPAQRVVAPGGRQQILATARYSDGSARDVSAASLFASNAALVADLSSPGLVQCGEVPGEAAITVNYMGQVASVAIRVPRPNAPDPYPELPVNNRIDELVWSKLRTMGLVPSEPVGDATFLRRLFLDTIGTLPSPEEVREFLSDASPDKRARWIDRVLARPEYADYWALIWSDILLVDREKLGERGAFELHRWLRRQFATNRPFDAWVRELLTATGNSARVGPVNFFRAADSPEVLARSVSQALLGVRVECAQCHHHPFERWSQDDFYGLASFFEGLQRQAVGPQRVLVFHAGYQESKIPGPNRAVPARPLGGEFLPEVRSRDPREVLAAWLTAADNPWFARLAANRLWKHYLGRGLVEPEDDLRTTNPATNPQLLDHLAQSLVAAKFDVQALTREILASRVYQLSSAPNETNVDDEQNFSRYYAKRLPAEVLLDAISAATGASEPFVGRPAGTRAIELWDNRLPSYFLEIFGRPERTSPCQCARSSEPTMAQALHLMNAHEVDAKVASPDGRVARLVAAGVSSDELAEELSLAALGQPLTAQTRAVAGKLFTEAPPLEAGQDFLWTLLNSYDFLFIR